VFIICMIAELSADFRHQRFVPTTLL